jgi:hypothetical protein
MDDKRICSYRVDRQPYNNRAYFLCVSKCIRISNCQSLDFIGRRLGGKDRDKIRRGSNRAE